MLGRDSRDNGVIEHALLGSDKRTVCLHDDPVLVTVIHNLSLLAERMKLAQAKSFETESRAGSLEVYNQWRYLDLIHGRRLEPRLGDLLEVVNATAHPFTSTFSAIVSAARWENSLI